MAVKSVIDVQVNDAEFAAFAELFAKYREGLAKTKGEWAAAGKEVAGVKGEFEMVAAAMLSAFALNRKITDEVKKQREGMRANDGYWKSALRGSREMATNVAGITKNILSWVGIGGIFTGLIGAGGLFGLDKLAGGVASTRRSALGLNTSYGEQRAFGLNYGRVVDTGSFLSGVQESMQDATKRQALYGAGLSERDLAGKDTAQVAAALLPKLKEIADRTPPALLAQMMRARGLDQFASLQDLERLRNTSKEELGGYGLSYERDRRTLGLDQRSQRAWQDFSVQLTRAGSKIENVFVRGLTPLTPALTRLSDAVATTVGTLMDKLANSGAIDKFAGGLKAAADYLASDAFQSNVKTFVDDVVALAGATHRALAFLGIVPKSAAENNAPEARDAAKNPNSGGNWAQRFKGGLESNSPEVFGPWANMIPGMAKVESNNNPRARSKAGAMGLMQLMPGTAKQYGVTDPFDPAQSKHGAALYLNDLGRHYGGDVTKMLAAYNWGQGNLDKAIKKYGEEWTKHLPKETDDYVRRNLRDRGTFFTAVRNAGDNKKIVLEINNFTGADVVTSANQAAGR